MKADIDLLTEGFEDPKVTEATVLLVRGTVDGRPAMASGVHSNTVPPPARDLTRAFVSGVLKWHHGDDRAALLIFEGYIRGLRDCNVPLKIGEVIRKLTSTALKTGLSKSVMCKAVLSGLIAGMDDASVEADALGDTWQAALKSLYGQLCSITDSAESAVN